VRWLEEREEHVANTRCRKMKTYRNARRWAQRRQRRTGV
jgi:hypothetical protein